MGAIRWRFKGNNDSRSIPAVAPDGTIYWGYSDYFVALTPAGELKWRSANLSGNYVFGSSPVVANDGSVYFNHDALFSTSSDGEIRWVFPYKWFEHSSPAIDADGIIYVGSSYSGFQAWNPDGQLKWEIPGAWGDPSIGADGTIYMQTYRSRLLAYDPNGTLLWTFLTDESSIPSSGIGAPPAVGPDGTLYFGSWATSRPEEIEYTHIYAVNPDGSLKWKLPIYHPQDAGAGVWVPPVLDRNGNVYVYGVNKSCYGIDPEGDLLWEFPIPAWHHIIPFIASDGEMLILDGTTLYGLTAATNTVYLPFAAAK